MSDRLDYSVLNRSFYTNSPASANSATSKVVFLLFQTINVRCPSEPFSRLVCPVPQTVDFVRNLVSWMLN